MAWLNPPTEEGLSPKRLVCKNKFDTFQSIFASQTIFQHCHASYEFFAHSYIIIMVCNSIIIIESVNDTQEMITLCWKKSVWQALTAKNSSPVLCFRRNFS